MPTVTEGQRPGRSAAAVSDALGAAYEQAFAGSGAHRRSLEWLLGRLAPGSSALEVGSGTGRPTAGTLARAGHDGRGVDVSPVMTALAARQVPAASFRCAGIRELPLEAESFDAVCGYFSLLRTTRAEQSAVPRRLAGVPRPGGYLAPATVPLDVQGADGVFMGQPVRVTGFDAGG